MTQNTKFLDLDAVDVGPKVVIKLQGVEHELKPVSVADFIANTKLLQGLGVDISMEQEIEAMIVMLIRAFPTMTADMLRNLPIAALNKMMEFARQNDGSQKVEEEAQAEAEANPPAAGA